jgi:C-terminal processing protease CtpA/Prc
MTSERRGLPDNSLSNSARAKYAGVGIVFQGVRGEALVVQSLTPGGPAELSGRVEVGDVLFTINEAKVADMDDSELHNFLHGMLLWKFGYFCRLKY